MDQTSTPEFADRKNSEQKRQQHLGIQRTHELCIYMYLFVYTTIIYIGYHSVNVEIYVRIFLAWIGFFNHWIPKFDLETCERLLKCPCLGLYGTLQETNMVIENPCLE